MMSAIGNIVINDGAATPVAHTFSPVGINAANVASWKDRSPAYPVGYNSLSLLLREPVNGSASRNYKMSLKLVLPTIDTSTGTPVKVYDAFASAEFVIPEQATLQNRKDLLALLKNALANAAITAAVQDLENVY